MRSAWIKAAIVAAGLLGASPIASALCGAASARAQPAGPQTAWKQIYESPQSTYYVDASAVRPTGRSGVTVLLEYKIAQVVDGVQVWSALSHMQVSCDERQLITIDNILYATKMGVGRVVASQPVSDAWHTPQPGSLGGLVWATACGKP